jgi:alpha-ketoglutarate-dependent taurine dioxygenase
MLSLIPFDPSEPRASFDQLVRDWGVAENKIFVLQPQAELESPREFYERHWSDIGTPYALAEDVGLGSREEQRSGEFWFEVRYEEGFENAYRHSPNAQPLHTDGSYIPEFPNATLMTCVSNSAIGGETIFLPLEALVSVLREDDPALLEFLTKTPVPHARSGDARTEYVLRREDGEWKVNWNYYCVDRDANRDHDDMIERFQHLLNNSEKIRAALIAVKLQPGEAVVWKDEELLHGRNGFQPKHNSERFLWKCAVDVGVFQ